MKKIREGYAYVPRKMPRFSFRGFLYCTRGIPYCTAGIPSDGSDFVTRKVQQKIDIGCNICDEYCQQENIIQYERDSSNGRGISSCKYKKDSLSRKEKKSRQYERNSDSRRGITSRVVRFRQSEAFRRRERDSFLQEERDSVSGKEIRLCSTVLNRGSPLDFRSG